MDRRSLGCLDADVEEARPRRRSGGSAESTQCSLSAEMMETDTIPESRTPSTAGSRWWVIGCGAIGAKLSPADVRTLRCTALLLLPLAIIELGVGGAAADICRAVDRQSVGAWWGALNPLIAAVVACLCFYENRVWNLFVQSIVAALVSFVGAVVEGMGANVVQQIGTVGQITNVTAAVLYDINPSQSYNAHYSHFMKLYGDPLGQSALLSCFKATPKNPSDLSFSNDDVTEFVSSLCGKSSSAKACVQAIGAEPKFSTSLCYTYSGTGYPGSCGTVDLHKPPAGLPQVHNCGQVLSVLGDATVGSTVLLTMLCVLSIIQSFNAGRIHFAQVRSGAGLAATAAEDSMLYAGTGTAKNAV